MSLNFYIYKILFTLVLIRNLLAIHMMEEEEPRKRRLSEERRNSIRDKGAAAREKRANPNPEMAPVDEPTNPDGIRSGGCEPGGCGPGGCRPRGCGPRGCRPGGCSPGSSVPSQGIAKLGGEAAEPKEGELEDEAQPPTTAPAA